MTKLWLICQLKERVANVHSLERERKSFKCNVHTVNKYRNMKVCHITDYRVFIYVCLFDFHSKRTLSAFVFLLLLLFFSFIFWMKHSEKSKSEYIIHDLLVLFFYRKVIIWISVVPKRMEFVNYVFVLLFLISAHVRMHSSILIIF